MVILRKPQGLQKLKGYKFYWNLGSRNFTLAGLCKIRYIIYICSNVQKIPLIDTLLHISLVAGDHQTYVWTDFGLSEYSTLIISDGNSKIGFPSPLRAGLIPEVEHRYRGINTDDRLNAGLLRVTAPRYRIEWVKLSFWFSLVSCYHISSRWQELDHRCGI